MYEASTLCDKMDRLIASKLRYLEKIKDNPKAFKMLQDEIFTLKEARDTAMVATNLYMNVAFDTIGRALIQAADKGCNGLVSYIPINDNYGERPRVGMFNPTINAPVCVSGEETEHVMLLHHFTYEVNNLGTGDFEPEVVHINPDIE